MNHFSIYLEIIAAVVIVVLYRSVCHQLFYGMPWSRKNPRGFFGVRSHRRKYMYDDSNDIAAFPGSTTWLVFLTDWPHLGQWIYAKLFYLIIANHLPLMGSNFITDSLWYSFFAVWGVLGGCLWATEQILKR